MSSQKPIFCLICDRAPGYFQMTIQAIKCLRKHTKTVAIGVLFPPGSGDLAENETAVLEALKNLDSKVDRNNIFFKEGTNHFENWNPTQHKLDIELFAKEYDPVIWLDSDTVVLKDLVPFINNFVSTGKKFAFLADHVNNDPNFKQNWEGPLFVPQACYMIFRSAYISPFFKIWEDTWREWITPYPFQRHKDPAPHFNNSFFCIEQYALGQSIFKYVNNFDNEVLRIDRGQLFIGRNVAVETQKIKQDFQKKSAARPSAVAHIPGDTFKKFQSALIAQPAPDSVPKSPLSVALGPVSPMGSTTDTFAAVERSFPVVVQSESAPTTSAAATTTPAATPTPAATTASAAPPTPAATTATATTTHTYTSEADDAGFIVTATYTTAPGAFLSDVAVSSSSTSSFPSGEGQIQALNVPSSYPTSYVPSSYVSSYSVSSYPTSYSRVTSYTTSYSASTTGVTSYTTSYTGGLTTSYTGGLTTSYTTSYQTGAVTSYASSYASSYPTSGSYGYVSSLPSSGGLSTLYTEDGGLPLTNYGNLTLQFSLPGESGETGNSSTSSMYVYGALDSNVYFLTTNAALTSSSQAHGLNNNNDQFYMVDLIQDNSIAHYYNANQGVNSSFVADHGSVVADTISNIQKSVPSKTAAAAATATPATATSGKGAPTKKK